MPAPARGDFSRSRGDVKSTGTASMIIDDTLRDKVTSCVISVNEALADNDVSEIEGFLKGYSRFLYDRIKNNQLKIGGENKNEKLSKLEKILSSKADENYVPNEEPYSMPPYNGKWEDMDRKQEEKRQEAAVGRLVRFLKDTTYRDYIIDMFKPGVDDNNKIIQFAKGVGMCWDNHERKYLSKIIEEDSRLHGGTIFYAIKRRKGGTFKKQRVEAVVRNFIGKDNKDRTYLFIDSLEGWDDPPSYSHHSMSAWEEGPFGVFKLAVITSIHLARQIGVDYIAIGDDAVIDGLHGTGFSKVRTAIGKKNHKIGYPARDSTDDGEKLVRSYFFNGSRNYCLYLK